MLCLYEYDAVCVSGKKKKRKEQKFFPGQTHRRKLEGTQEKTKPPSTLKGFSKVAASIKSLFGYRSSSGFDFLNVKKIIIIKNVACKLFYSAKKFGELGCLTFSSGRK